MKAFRVVGQIAFSTIVGFVVSAFLVLLTKSIFHWGSGSHMTDAQYNLILVWGVLSLLLIALLSRWIAYRWVKHETTLLDLFALSLVSAFVGIVLTTAIVEFMGISYRYTNGPAGLSEVFTAKRAFDVLNGYIMFLVTTWLNQFFIWVEMRTKNERTIVNY